MRRTSGLMLLVCTLAALSFPVLAQAPTGIITGTVTDESGALVPHAKITITNRATDFMRAALANAEGFYSAPALPAGDYQVRCEQPGFRTTVRAATVQAGTTTAVDLSLQVGGGSEVVSVKASGAQINYDSHSIQGVIQQASIENLPLNGRSYMQLAKLEPGVTIASGSVAQFNALFTVSVLGAGNRTLFTVDGGNVSDNIDVGGGISWMNFSQETVQEFQEFLWGRMASRHLRKLASFRQPHSRPHSSRRPRLRIPIPIRRHPPVPPATRASPSRVVR